MKVTDSERMISLQNNDTNRNDSLKEIHTTFDSDGSISEQSKRIDLIPKILSVVAAIALWLYVYQAVGYEKTFNGITIEIQENFVSGSGLSIVNNYERTVDVTLSGTKSSIDSIDVTDIKAFVDLNDVTEADVYTCGVEINVPAGVDVVDKSVEQLRIEVDKTVDIDVTDISVNHMYTIQSPYEIGEVSFGDGHDNPIKQFTLSGPETDVITVAKAVIELDLGKVSNTVNSNVKSSSAVKLYDMYGNAVDSKYIRIKPEIISVNIPVYKTKQVGIAPNLIMDKTCFEYKTRLQKVDIYGEVNKVDRIDSVETLETLILQKGSYLIALKEYDGISVYKSGSERTEDNKVTAVSIDVTEIEKAEIAAASVPVEAQTLPVDDSAAGLQ